LANVNEGVKRVTLDTVHIIKKHENFGEITKIAYLDHRQVDEYMCGLMAFNDEFSEKDKSNFHRTVNMFILSSNGIEKYDMDSVHVPMIFYDPDVTSEDSFCGDCRFHFYQLGGLMMTKSMLDKMRGVDFMPKGDVKVEDKGKSKKSGTGIVIQ